MTLPRASEGLYLLQRVRDKVHRSAITHRRDRRSKATLSSAPDVVPGPGEMRREALISHSGSLKKLHGVIPEEIAVVPGIGPRLIAAIYKVIPGTGGEVINLATGEVIST